MRRHPLESALSDASVRNFLLRYMILLLLGDDDADGVLDDYLARFSERSAPTLYWALGTWHYLATLGRPELVRVFENSYKMGSIPVTDWPRDSFCKAKPDRLPPT
jgi:hypothetical protein